MKRLTVLLAAAVLWLLWCGSGWAKWYQVGSDKAGAWAVSDGDVKHERGCKFLLAGLLYKQLKPTLHGKAAVQQWYLRACCQAGTVQFLAYRYLNSQRKQIFRQWVKNQPMKPQSGSIPYAILRKACSAGFGMR